MLDAAPVGASRRVQGIADQHQAPAGQTFGHSHRTDAPAHRSSPKPQPRPREAGALGQRRRLLLHRAEQDGSAIGGPATSLSVREVHALDDDPEGGDGVVHRHEGGLVSVGAGAGSEKEAARRRA